MTRWRNHYARRAARMESAEVRDLLAILARRDVISFAGGVPDPALFPTEAIRASYDRVLGDTARARVALQYSQSEGDPGLREWIAADMARHGVSCTAANVLVTNGSQQGLDFIGKLFISPDDLILVSRPTFLGALQAFNAYEPRYGALPGAEDGGPDSGSAAKFAYVMPEFENPTGLTLSREDRVRLLDVADARDVPIIEDSPYETLRYAGEAPPALLALDAERAGGIDRCRVIHLGTFSKSIAPAFRIGWMVGPREVIAQLALVKQASDIQVSTVNQLVMLDVAPEIMRTQAARVRPIYRARRDAMLRALRLHMPAGVAWTEPEGGFFVWLSLPPGLDSAALLKRAVEEVKVAFVPGAAFFADRSGQDRLRLSFSLNGEDATAEGIERLAGLVREAMA